jgi:hypothetical protein
MARFAVRSGAVAFARPTENPGNQQFERTRANGREHRSLAMQKVVGSSPIIRSQTTCKAAGAVVCVVNGSTLVAKLRVELLPLSTTGAQPVAPAAEQNVILRHAAHSFPSVKGRRIVRQFRAPKSAPPAG